MEFWYAHSRGETENRERGNNAAEIGGLMGKTGKQRERKGDREMATEIE